MIRMTFQHLAKAKASVYRYSEKDEWWATVKVYDTKDNAITFETGDYPHKVEAIMAAMDAVDVARAAVQKLADDEGMRDIEDSVEEKRLIDNGTEALPEPATATTPNAVTLQVMRDTDKLFDELGAAMRQSEPDGPIADSVEGYRVSADEVLDDHDSDCDCTDCVCRREDDARDAEDRAYDERKEEKA